MLLCCLLCADVTTKDLLTDRQLWRNPPCCPGARSAANLVRSWYVLCCAPTSYRPWQRQQRDQHVWRQLPVSDDAVLAGGAAQAGTGGSNALLPGPQGTSATHVTQEQHVEASIAGAGAAAAPGAALLHRQQPQQQEGSSCATDQQQQQRLHRWGGAEV